MNLILKNAPYYFRGNVLRSDLVISEGKIIQMGKVSSRDFPGFERWDCGNMLVLPGFIDSHLHLEALAQTLEDLDLRDCVSLQEVLSKVAKFAEKLPQGAWITGGRWNKNNWEKKVFPTKRALDSVTKEHPAMLWSKDGHALWLNSLALQILHIDRETPDPPGGKILKEEDGEPSGILLENAADIYGGKFAHPESKGSDLKRATRYLLERGITGVNWFLEKGEEPFSLFSRLDALDLEIDLTIWFPGESLESVLKSRLKSGDGSQRVKLGGIKLFADGALGSQSAFMLEPYEGLSNSGIEVTPRRELEEIIRVLAPREVAVSVHAIGDAAVRNSTLAFFPFRDLNSKLRNRVEHVQLIQPQDRKTFSESGLLASVQPIHAISDREMACRLWGERVKYSYPYRSLLDLGIPVAFGSDAPVEEPSPLQGIYAACTRKTPFIEEDPFLPQEALTLSQALDAYTFWGAWSMYQEKAKGEIALGRKADLVLLSENIFRLPLSQMGKARVLLTISGGKIFRPDL